MADTRPDRSATNGAAGRSGRPCARGVGGPGVRNPLRLLYLPRAVHGPRGVSLLVYGARRGRGSRTPRSWWVLAPAGFLWRDGYRLPPDERLSRSRGSCRRRAGGARGRTLAHGPMPPLGEYRPRADRLATDDVAAAQWALGPLQLRKGRVQLDSSRPGGDLIQQP